MINVFPENIVEDVRGFLAVSNLFIRFLGAEDTYENRMKTLTFLVELVAASVEPGLVAHVYNLQTKDGSVPAAFMEIFNPEGLIVTSTENPEPDWITLEVESELTEEGESLKNCKNTYLAVAHYYYNEWKAGRLKLID